MAKANSARIKGPEGAAITVDQRLVARGDKTPGKQAWARALIRKAIEALRREGVPLDDLTNWPDYRSLLEMDEGTRHARQ